MLMVKRCESYATCIPAPALPTMRTPVMMRSVECCRYKPAPLLPVVLPVMASLKKLAEWL